MVDLFNNSIMAVTGHRPDKLGGYSNFDKLVYFASCEIKMHNPRIVITGMALGWDQAIAQACVTLNIPFIAAVPFQGQDKIWPIESQQKYKELLNKAQHTVLVSNGSYHPSKMQIRNKWMVDQCSYLNALWNGSEGGTANCVKYAKNKKVKVYNCWEHWASLNV